MKFGTVMKAGCMAMLAVALLLGAAACTNDEANRNGGNGGMEASPTPTVSADSGGTEASVPPASGSDGGNEGEETPVPTASEPAKSDEQQIAELGGQALTAIRDDDYAALQKLAHPEGILFSPYGYVAADEAIQLTSDQIGGLSDDATVRTWGTADGSGEPINLTWEAYRQKFVYDKDFLKADETGFNKRIGEGNSSDNVKEVFPDANTMEYHFKGTEENSQMDWASLRLVWEKSDGQWKLRAIVHDQWTI